MEKKVLVDLSELKNIYHGLGQVALAFGNYFKENYSRKDGGYSLTLLLPKPMFGMFGDEVDYMDSSGWFNKYFHHLFPTFDVWHSLYQLSRFKPASSRTKLILTVHDLNYLYVTKGRECRQKHRRMQRRIDRADKIVCISEFTKYDIERNLSLKGKTCEVIYNEVESLLGKPSSQPACEIKKPFFLTVGVARPLKNFHVLLDMMKLIPDKHLYIAGENRTEYGEMIQERIREEGIKNVTLLGAVSEREKVWLYTHCEAFLFPSLFEGFGMPVIEAMQFGKPVFSSAETSLAEIGGDYAYFWRNFDPREMKQLVDENLLNFYQDKDLVKRQTEYALSFSQGKFFEKYMELYARL